MLNSPPGPSYLMDLRPRAHVYWRMKRCFLRPDRLQRRALTARAIHGPFGGLRESALQAVVERPQGETNA